MKNIAIIPARSGSKGLKDKNIKNLNGLPLLVYSINAAKESDIFDEIMVSTDSQLYADISVKYGANVPFLRSKKQSDDNAESWNVVKEVLTKYWNIGKTFETICLLQPTSPLRKADDIINGYKLLKEKNAEAITSVCEMEHSPFWSMTLPTDLSLIEFRKKISSKLPRQKLEIFYRINGALYIRKILYKKNEVTLCDSKEYALIMERNRSIDIDDEYDFRLAQFLLALTT